MIHIGHFCQPVLQYLLFFPLTNSALQKEEPGYCPGNHIGSHEQLDPGNSLPQEQTIKEQPSGCDDSCANQKSQQSSNRCHSPLHHDRTPSLKESLYLDIPVKRQNLLL